MSSIHCTMFDNKYYLYLYDLLVNFSTPDTGRVRHYCVHNVTKGNSTVEIELLLDSKFETRDCQRCTCSRMGLTCCG